MPIDPAKDLLLITAASGKQATALLPFLTPTWKRLRLQCISTTSAQRLQKQYPTAEVIQSSFSDLHSARNLLSGVTACVLILPAFHPRETQHGLNMMDAATENLNSSETPFRHMVFSSVLHSCLRALANHDNKRLVEEALIESPLPYTIVQPSHVMENVPIAALAKQENAVFPARFDPATKFSFTSTYDLGEAMAKILADPEKHLYAIYPLVSTPKPMDYYEAMEIVSGVIGKEIRIRRLTLEETEKWFAGTIAQGTGDEERKAILRSSRRLMAYYESKGLVGNSSVMELVLGRKPLGYREWVEMQVK